MSTTPTPEPVFARATEVARLLGVSRRTVSAWLRNPPDGFPRARRIKNRRYFLRSEILAWVQREEAARAV
jgi:predicted DNA-binding transcriptional regulator AlpA